jgi:hypothetical protein
MCYLITIGTAESPRRVEALVGDMGGLSVRPSRNPSLRSVFPLSDHLFQVTSGHCSCDLVPRKTRPSVEQHRARLRAKYEQAGWSTGKIGRALADWEAAHERQRRARAEPHRQFLSLLRVLSSSPGGLRLVVHFYSGQFDTEAIRSTGKVSVPFDRIGEIGGSPEDSLVEVSSRAD